MTPTAGVSSMVERVARAMCDDLGVNPDDWHEEGGVRVYAWQKEAGTAKAAILAMREPTEEMKDAACEVGSDTNSGPFSYDNAEWVWRAMIDAALGQNPLSGT